MPNNKTKTSYSKKERNYMIIQADKPICAAFKGNTYYLDLGSPSEPISLSPINTVNKFCVDKDDDGESPYFVIYVTDDCNIND